MVMVFLGRHRLSCECRNLLCLGAGSLDRSCAEGPDLDPARHKGLEAEVEQHYPVSSRMDS